VHIYKVKGAANSEHSISEEERYAFSEHINRVLGADSFLSQRLPMDPNSGELFTQAFPFPLFTAGGPPP
jgi:hypothetical protein